MRMFPAVALATMLLAGCVPTPSPSPTADPSPTPVFATEEEALAAAGEAYGAYQAAVDRALMTLDASGLESVATGLALEGAFQSIESLREKGQVQVGLSKIDTVSLARVELAEIQLYACLDVAGTDIVNVAGDSVLPPDRETRYPLVVTLIVEARDSLLVEEEQVWTGENFC